MFSSHHNTSLLDHPTLTSCDDMAEIMLPQLKQHGITVFNYYRIYSDNTLVRLSTDSKWSKHYFQMNYISNLTVPTSSLSKKMNYFIWMEDDCPEMLKDAAHNFNTSNGISFTVRHHDSIEYFCFASTLENKAIINNFYINNLDILSNYASYFKDKAHSIIKSHEDDKIFFTNSVLTDQIRSNNSNLVQLHKNEKILLTLKQNIIIKRLMSGYSVKSIADELCLSPRTIEDHILKLRIKVGARNVVQLVSKVAQLVY